MRSRAHRQDTVVNTEGAENDLMAGKNTHCQAVQVARNGNDQEAAVAVAGKSALRVAAVQQGGPGA